MARKTQQAPEPQVTNEPICKFAGDNEDEFCSKCSGITMKDDKGNDVPCTQCGGYEIGENVAATPEPAPEPEPTPTPPPATGSKRTAPATKPADTKPATPPPAPEPEPEPAYESDAVVREIKAESGVSFEMKDAQGMSRWYKFGYSETRVLSPDCDLEAERQALWDDVNGVVDDQVSITLDSLNG